MTADEKTTVGMQIVNNSQHQHETQQKSTAATAATAETEKTPTVIAAAMTKHDIAKTENIAAKPTTTATQANVIAPTELTENFYINNRRKNNNVKIQVKLSGSGIFFRRETEQRNNINEQLIHIEDIIGSRFGSRLKKRVRGSLISCRRNLQIQENDNDDEKEKEKENSSAVNNQKKDTSAYLYVYAYIKSEKANGGGAYSRFRTVRILRFRTYDRFEANLKIAERWHRGIRLNKNLYCRSSCAANATVAAAKVVPMAEAKPLLIFLNPKSGSGNGRELFQKQVVPILKEADAHYELHITTHANHAREFVRCRKDIENCYSGIVVASGDGLFYEVLNGLMERSDWQSVCAKLSIGIIPCGSGNGLAKSIAHLYNESYEKPIMLAALTCVSGHSTPMDVVRLELARKSDQPSKPIEMYSFLSVGWGLIADIDIESERLRSIGAQRFTIWSIHRLISLRTYKGKLSYLRWVPTERNVKQQTNQHESKKLIEIKSEKLNDAANGFHDALEEPCNGDDDDDDDDFFADASSVDFRQHVDSWHSATSRRTAYYSIAGQSVHSRKSLTPSIYSKLEAANNEFETRISAPPAATIPPLNMPLPEETWSSENGEFIMVHAAYTTHLSTDCHFAPDSRLNDGIIYLVVIRAGCSRSQLLQFLLGMSSGTHIPGTPNEYIEVVPVSAFRIEPEGDDGIMAVDGERVDYGSIQGEIFPGIINVMVPSGKLK